MEGEETIPKNRTTIRASSLSVVGVKRSPGIKKHGKLGEHGS
jgi:hypothetical protein